MRLYLDSCCFNRPFDDQHVDRIRLEAEAILSILERVRSGDLGLIGSPVLDHEIGRIQDRFRREVIQSTLATAGVRAELDGSVLRRGRDLQAIGFHRMDALHLAAAEQGEADVFLSVDDRLLRRATRCGSISMVVQSPPVWLEIHELSEEK